MTPTIEIEASPFEAWIYTHDLAVIIGAIAIIVMIGYLAYRKLKKYEAKKSKSK